MELKNQNKSHSTTTLNHTLSFSYQILNIKSKITNINLKIKQRSIATLRSPHVDKRGIDQFHYLIYRSI